MEIISDNIDDLINQAIAMIQSEGNEVAPRGMLVKEVLGAKLILNNPRNRISYNPVRNLRLSFAIGEFLWYISGSSDCKTISYYNKRYQRFSDDGEKLNGAYGKRIFKPVGDRSQWQRVFELLKADSDTRQAVISIFHPNDLMITTKDVPCTCTLQFFIRDNRLNCIVYMRSNDLIWGTPYDIFSFTMMQDLMASALGIDLGYYMHIAGSLHIYEYHYDLTMEMYQEKGYQKYTMPAMPEEIDKELDLLQDIEYRIRNRLALDVFPSTDYVRNLLGVTYAYSVDRYQYPYEYTNLTIPDYLNIHKKLIV